LIEALSAVASALRRREAIPLNFEPLAAALINELEAFRAERHDERLSAD